MLMEEQYLEIFESIFDTRTIRIIINRHAPKNHHTYHSFSSVSAAVRDDENSEKETLVGQVHA